MILQFFAAFIGAAGFGFLFHLQFKHIFPAALGGVLTWVCLLYTYPSPRD